MIFTDLGGVIVWVKHPFRSRAIYLAYGNMDTALQEFKATGGFVIREHGDFQIESIEPFLAPLRVGTGRAS
jgi:hypothetical protein